MNKKKLKWIEYRIRMENMQQFDVKGSKNERIVSKEEKNHEYKARQEAIEK